MEDSRHNQPALIDLSTIASSEDLTSDVIQHAASSARELKTLVMRLGEIARPEEGWTAKVFKVISKVASASFVEGDLEVDFSGDDKGTTVTFYSVLGAGIRERLFGAQYVQVPIDEFQRALVLAPTLVAPLTAYQALNRLTLSFEQRAANNAMPDYELEEKAKGDGERVTAPPPADHDLDPHDHDHEHESDDHTRPTMPPRSE